MYILQINDYLISNGDEKMKPEQATKDITIAELCKIFKKAVIIDIDRKMLLVINDNKGKIYPEEHYKKLLDGLNLTDFEDDTNGDD